jgi:hypothetical protein
LRRKPPSPVLNLPGDPSVPNIPGSLAFKRKGGEYATGKLGRAVRFDGKTYSEAKVSLPAGNAPRTLAVWLKSDREPVAHLVHPITYGPVESGKPFGIMEASGRWGFFDYGGGLDTGVGADRQWHHHAATFDGATVRYFLDGRRVASVERKLTTAPGVLAMGGYSERAKNFLGMLDELYVFDVAPTRARSGS